MASAAILSGGRATRLGGRDKSSLRVGGRRIIDRQLDELRPLTDDILIVGGRPDPGLRGRRSPHTPSIRHVADRVAGRGPLGGLDAALAEARDPIVIVVASDMPFLTAPLLAYLVSLAPMGQAVVPRTKRGYHPLCAVYTRGCRSAIQRRLAAGQLALVGLLDELQVRAVDLAELEAFGSPDLLLTNVNTPDEYRATRSFTHHEP